MFIADTPVLPALHNIASVQTQLTDTITATENTEMDMEFQKSFLDTEEMDNNPDYNSQYPLHTLTLTICLQRQGENVMSNDFNVKEELKQEQLFLQIFE